MGGSLDLRFMIKMEDNKEETEAEKRAKSLYGKERYRARFWGLRNMIDKRVLKTQIKADLQLKETFRELYPNEFNKALDECKKRYGATPRKKIRRAEVIREMGVTKQFQNEVL